MLKNKRQLEIVEILKAEGFATVTSLAKRLFASLPTIRRDLTALETSGYVKRCHGGAMIVDGGSGSPIHFRLEKRIQEKTNMCQVAAELISDGDVLFVDGSSTVFRISDYLSSRKKVTVVTNSHLATERFARAGASIYSTGGKLLYESFVFVGSTAESAVERYSADLLFFSVAAISEDGVLSDWSEEERDLRLKMVKNARCKVFLFDSGKIGKRFAFKLFPISELDYLITDKPLSPSLISQYSLELVKSEPAYLYKCGKRR